MKKLFTVLGAIVFVVIIALAVGFFILSRGAAGLDKEARAYIDANIPVIMANWDPAELIKRASPELMKVAPREKIEELFAVFAKRLGPLREYQGSKGEANISFTFKTGKVVTAAFSSQAVFEKAPALILCRIVKLGDHWQITSFRVNSEALVLPPEKGATTAT